MCCSSVRSANKTERKCAGVANVLNALGLLTLLFWSGLCLADFTICNNTKNTVAVAGVQHKSIFLENLWTSGGWFVIDSGDCHIMHPYTNQRFRGFLSIVRIKGGNKKIWLTSRSHNNKHVTVVDRFFCVSWNKFDRRRLPLSSHKNCPAGWHLQLFNYYVDVYARNMYTLTLTE